jgi:hypothetical protein
MLTQPIDLQKAPALTEYEHKQQSKARTISDLAAHDPVHAREVSRYLCYCRPHHLQSYCHSPCLCS